MAKRARPGGAGVGEIESDASSTSSGSLTMELLGPLVDGLGLRDREMLRTTSKDPRALITADNLLQFGTRSINPPTLRIFNLKPGDKLEPLSWPYEAREYHPVSLAQLNRLARRMDVDGIRQKPPDAFDRIARLMASARQACPLYNLIGRHSYRLQNNDGRLLVELVEDTYEGIATLRIHVNEEDAVGASPPLPVPAQYFERSNGLCIFSVNGRLTQWRFYLNVPHNDYRLWFASYAWDAWFVPTYARVSYTREFRIPRRNNLTSTGLANATALGWVENKKGTYSVTSKCVVAYV
jgi:hypothetical protein